MADMADMPDLSDRLLNKLAVRLSVALARLSDRVERLCRRPPAACSCGAVFATAGDLEEHFWDVFVPEDDTGLDGKTHAEVCAR